MIESINTLIIQQIKINIISTDGSYSYDKVIINKGYNRDCNKLN